MNNTTFLAASFVTVVIEAVIGASIIIGANFAMKKILAFFRKRSIPNIYDWRENVEEIFYLPLHLMLWIVAVVYVVDIVGTYFGLEASISYLKLLRNACVVGCLGWTLIRWKSHMQRVMIAKRQSDNKMVDMGMLNVFGRLLSIIISVLTVLIALQILGINVLPLLAFGGIGAAAIGFAARDVIANFFGGLMLHTTRPFTLRDQVLILEKNIEGVVEDIGWYLTFIRDKEKRPVYLPNALFSTTVVVNLSRMSHRRILESIGIRSQDFPKLKIITDEIHKAISTHPSIDTKQPVLVAFDSFKEYSLNIYIDAYTLATRMDQYLAVKEEILISINEIITNAGAVIPNPSYTLTF